MNQVLSPRPPLARRERGPGHLVVGVDSLLDSAAAVRWAALEAGRRGVQLVIVHAEPYAERPWSLGQPFSVRRDIDRASRLELERARLLAQRTAGISVRLHFEREHPRSTLLAAAEDADLVVVGACRNTSAHDHTSRHRGLGSTSLHLAANAPCPVVIVRSESTPGQGVVAGYDGSPSAVAGVRWAAREAEISQQELVLLTCWTPPPAPAFGWTSDVADQLRRSASESAQELQADLLGNLRGEHPGLSVRGEIVAGSDPADALLQTVDQAAILVLGATGHGSFTGALLGSTVHSVLHRSRRPVAVVPPDVPTRLKRPGRPGGRPVHDRRPTTWCSTS